MHAESATGFQRPIYAGNALLTIDVPAGTKVVAKPTVDTQDGQSIKETDK